jgi:hypothetical protein
MRAGNCPVCNSPSQLEVHTGVSAPIWYVGCPRCGEYAMNDLAKGNIERALQMPKTDIAQFLPMTDAPDQRSDIDLYIEVAKKARDETRMDIPRSIISHVLRKRMDKRGPLTSDLLAGILKNNSLPTPAEQANNLISYLGEILPSPGHSYEVKASQTSQENIIRAARN